MFKLMDFFYRYFGNFGVAILMTTIVVKALFFPLASKQYASMANMKRVQPKMAELKEKFGDDRMALQQATMALYKEEKINPIAGCWPIALQIPIFFSLYKVIYITIEMRHAPFFGWIQDLSAPDPTSIVNLFGLLPFAAPAFVHLGVWPLIMGATMFLQMRMNPTPPDPTQAMIFNWMPLVFMFMLGSFPAGLVIYWAWNNTLSVIQQSVIMKRHGVKLELFDNLKGLFRRKPAPSE
jgi:YidC/Oxa1 family membrane protein insertase